MTDSAPAADDLVARSHELLRRWDVQQASYVTHHSARFDMMVDVIEQVIPADGVVVDLACGPGSISARLLDRMPEVRSVAVDYDPVLLELGRQALASHGDRLRFVDVDLFDPDWTDVLGGMSVHAVLSSTALHWLPAHVLTRVYADVYRILEPGGVLLNADHLRHLDGRELFAELSRRDDERTQRRGRADGVPTWQEWWEEVVAVDHYARLAAERERRFAERPPNPDLSLAFHVNAMLMAGFAEAGSVWQHFDDYIVLARR